jgi:uncharacterized protein
MSAVAPLHTQESSQRATIAHIAPFLTFLGIMALEKVVPLPPQWLYAVRFVVVCAVIAAVSRPYLSFRPSVPLASIGIGAAVFVLWIAPDFLFGYRHFWLFENSITGTATSSFPPQLKQNVGFMVLRSLSSAMLVPVLEELFWRAWMMRWLINPDFQKVPLGKYVPSAFWIVAILFASEHGPYWEVGLVAGIIYNWWIVRTRNLADCILAHGVTNAILALYVVLTGQWQYWL